MKSSSLLSGYLASRSQYNMDVHPWILAYTLKTNQGIEYVFEGFTNPCDQWIIHLAIKRFYDNVNS